jgi:hypothetical protein
MLCQWSKVFTCIREHKLDEYIYPCQIKSMREEAFIWVDMFCYRSTYWVNCCTREVHMIPNVVCIRAAEPAWTWKSFDYFWTFVYMHQLIKSDNRQPCHNTQSSQWGRHYFTSVTYKYICLWSYSNPKVCLLQFFLRHNQPEYYSRSNGMYGMSMVVCSYRILLRNAA